MTLDSFLSYLTVSCIRRCSPDDFDHFGTAGTQHGQQRLHRPPCFHNVLVTTQKSRSDQRNQKTHKNHHAFHCLLEDRLTSTIKTFCTYGRKKKRIMEGTALWVRMTDMADYSNLARETGQLVSSDDFDAAALVVLQDRNSINATSRTLRCL